MSHPELNTELKREIPHWYTPDSKTLSIAEGNGVRVWDEDGTEYLDFISQLYCANLGHDNPAIREAIDDQVGTIPYVSSAKMSPIREELANRLADIVPGNLSDTFFSISGSEANEMACHLAREYTSGRKILTRWQSYHGATAGSGALTGDPSTRNALERHAGTTGTGKFLPPLPRAFDTDDPETLAQRAANHLEFVIRNEGPDDVAAVLTEPVAGTSGAYTAPADYFQRVRRICDEYDVLLISDEVITGFGRCGEWFGIETEGVDPDMITFAKGATGAFMPLAGVVTRSEIAGHVADEGLALGQTFGGHPVACAAGLAALDAYEDGVIENVRENAPILRERLREIASRHEVVTAVRGRGYHWSVVFADPTTGEPFHHPWVDSGDNPVDDVITACRDRGVLVGGGRPRTQVVLSPPLVATDDDLREGLDALDGAIGAVF